MFYEIGAACARKDDISKWEVSVLEHEYLLGIGCIGRSHHLGSCNFLREMLSNIRIPPSPSTSSCQKHHFYRSPTVTAFECLSAESSVTFNLPVQWWFNHESSKSTFFMFKNMTFDILLSTVFDINIFEFFVSYNKTITRTSSFLLCVLISVLFVT